MRERCKIAKEWAEKVPDYREEKRGRQHYLYALRHRLIYLHSEILKAGKDDGRTYHRKAEAAALQWAIEELTKNDHRAATRNSTGRGGETKTADARVDRGNEPVPGALMDPVRA